MAVVEGRVVSGTLQIFAGYWRLAGLWGFYIHAWVDKPLINSQNKANLLNLAFASGNSSKSTKENPLFMLFNFQGRRELFRPRAQYCLSLQFYNSFLCLLLFFFPRPPGAGGGGGWRSPNRAPHHLHQAQFQPPFSIIFQRGV